MDIKKVASLRKSFTEKCFKEMSVVDSNLGKFIVEDNGQFFIVKIDVCEELPYELLNRFQEKRSKRETLQLKKKVKDFFT